MNALILPATASTPAIDFNYEKGILYMAGRSTDNNAALFFRPLINWVDIYVTNAPSDTTLHLNMDYSNTPSIACLLSIIKKLKCLKDSGKGFNVIWEYHAGDDDMLQNGHTYSDMLNMPFEFIKDEEE